MKLPVCGDEIDLVAVGRLALDGGDGAGEDPGMPAVERAGRVAAAGPRAAFIGQSPSSFCTASM